MNHTIFREPGILETNRKQNLSIEVVRKSPNWSVLSKIATTQTVKLEHALIILAFLSVHNPDAIRENIVI